MRGILIVWHDLDHSRTAHEFATAEEAEAWLRDVLQEHCPHEELERGGYTPDGIGMLGLYQGEGIDDVGSIEVYIDGIGVGPEALSE